VYKTTFKVQYICWYDTLVGKKDGAGFLRNKAVWLAGGQISCQQALSVCRYQVRGAHE
jgi:hypothetical protein